MLQPWMGLKMFSRNFSLRLWMRLKRFLSRNFVLCVNLTVIAAVFIIAYLCYIRVINDTKTGIGLLTAVPLFLLTILQYLRTQQVQRASYIKEFLAEFRKNEHIYNAYYDLIYSYGNPVFKQVMHIVNDIDPNQQMRKTTENKPVFHCFEHLQGDRKPGSRIYHPQLFWFSPEERRLDGLLDYFNSIGFYMYSGLIEMEDIANILGDYINVIAERKIIEEYLNICNEENWEKYQGLPPYFYLRFLIESFKNYNLEFYTIERKKTLYKEIDILKKKQTALKRKQAQNTESTEIE